MLTLFPNTTSPISGLLQQHGAMVLIVVAALISLAILIIFGKPGSGDGAGFDGFGMDGGNGDGGCSAD